MMPFQSSSRPVCLWPAVPEPELEESTFSQSSSSPEPPDDDLDRLAWNSSSSIRTRERTNSLRDLVRFWMTHPTPRSTKRRSPKGSCGTRTQVARRARTVITVLSRNNIMAEHRGLTSERPDDGW